jgi:hypothetical protein
LNGCVVNSSWSGDFSALSGTVAVKPVDYNTSISPGETTSFGFCANAPNAGSRPVLAAWNMESAVYATCPSNSGVDPGRAGLAVAMATELGRWDPVNDLTVVDGYVVLSDAGLAQCGSGCPNTKALLGLQENGLMSLVDQAVFNPTVFREELKAGFDRATTTITSLSWNDPSSLPPAHKLRRVAGPTNLGLGACGPHYVFEVTKPDGSPLSAAETAAMPTALCFYGGGSCGGNPYIAFTQTTLGCPDGSTCIAIDPTDGDNASESTTTAGSAPTYPRNSVYDPTNQLLGTACITTAGALGTIVSYCSVLKRTCGMLYCIATR